MARPTNYTTELVAKAKQYLAQCKNKLPQVAGLALFLDVSRDTLYEWAKVHDEFSDIFKKVLTAQEEALVRRGLAGIYNPTITKLMLSKHGYRDSQDITTDGKALPTPLLDRGLSTNNSTGEDTTAE